MGSTLKMPPARLLKIQEDEPGLVAVRQGFVQDSLPPILMPVTAGVDQGSASREVMADVAGVAQVGTADRTQARPASAMPTESVIGEGSGVTGYPRSGHDGAPTTGTELDMESSVDVPDQSAAAVTAAVKLTSKGMVTERSSTLQEGAAGAAPVLSADTAGTRRTRTQSSTAVTPSKEADDYGVFDPVHFDACLDRLQALEGEGLLTDMKRGEHLADLKRSSGDKARFETTLKSRYGMSDKQARNLIGVKNRFWEQRERWAAIGVSASHLRRLTTSPGEVVETIYQEFLASGVLSTAALDDRLRDLKGRDHATAAAGGAALAKARLAELRSIARKNADPNIADFQDSVAEVVGILEKGLGIHRDGVTVTIRRTALSKAALRPARCAARILEGVFTRFVPGPAFDWVSGYARVTTDAEELRAVRSVLIQLGKVERWPKENAAAWVSATVLPILRWAIGRDPVEPLAIDAILDRAVRDFDEKHHFPADYVAARKARIGIDPPAPTTDL